MPSLYASFHPSHYKSVTGASQPARTLNHGTNFSIMTLDCDAATDELANCQAPIPFAQNASTTPNIMTYRTAATSGNSYMGGNYDSDQNTTTVSTGAQFVSDAAQGTTLFANQVVFDPATEDPTADRLQFMQIGRDADNASDTQAGDAQIMSSHYAMTSLSSLGLHERFILPRTFTLPTAGAVTLTTVYATTNVCDALSFPNGGGYAECVFTLPRYFTGNLKITTWVNPGDTGTTEWRHDLSYVALGESFDTAVTAGSAFTVTGGAATSFYQDKQRAALSGAAAGDTVHLRVRRTANGTSTAAALLLAIHISYDIGANHGQIDLSPGSFLIPTSNPGTVVVKQDTNNSYYVSRFAAGATTNLHNQATIPNAWLAGGILRVRWITTGSGSLQLKALYSYVAAAEGTDPSPTDPGTQTTLSSGAGKLNETSFIMTGAAKLDTLLLKLQRQSGDNIAANVEIVDAWWEFIPV